MPLYPVKCGFHVSLLDWGEAPGDMTYAAPLWTFLTPPKALDREAIALATYPSFIRGFVTTLLTDAAGPATSSESR